MKKLLVIVSTAVILMGGCTQEQTKQKEEAVTPTEKTHDHQSSENEMSIMLNEGQKWKVNSEMMVHVVNMEKDIQSFQGQSLEDHKALAAKITNHIGELTSSCTMTGRSHEELHKWLHPFIELSEKFENSDSEATAQQNYDEIKKQMEVFHQYFE